jgi:hypothetical protein
MGHDLYLKNCPSPPKDACINGGACDHECLTNTHISFNFTQYSAYWYIGHAHGHKGCVIAVQIQAAIDRLINEGVGYLILSGQDEWSPALNVFHYHLRRIMAIILEYPDCTMISNNMWVFIPDPNDVDDKDSIYPIDNPLSNIFYISPDGNGNAIISNAVEQNRSVSPDSVSYYRHPLKGNIKVHNFATACEVYTLAVMNNDIQADHWLSIAKMMSDAPSITNKKL